MGERGKIIAAWSALAFIWGSTYLAIRVGVLTFPPFLMAGVRFLVAGTVLVAVARSRKAEFPRGREAYATLALTAVLLMVGGNGGVTWAEQTAPSGIVAMLASTSPLVLGFLSLLAPPSERLRPAGWAGLVLGLIGLAILTRPSPGQHVPPLAAAACFLAVTCWGIGSLVSRHRAPKCDAVAATGIQMLIGAAILLTVGFFTERGLKQPVHWPAVAAVAYLTVFGSAVAFTLFFWLLSKAPAARVATYAYVNPVVAVILGWLILKEPLTAPMAAGCAVTLCGVILTNAGRAPAPEPMAVE